MAKNGLPDKVLYIEEETLGHTDALNFLKSQDVKVDVAKVRDNALFYITNNTYDVAIISLEFPEMPGILLAQRFREQELLIRRATGIITTLKSKSIKASDQVLAEEMGGVETIAQPFKGVNLIPYLQRAMNRQREELSYLELVSKVVDFHRKNKNMEKAAEAVKKKMSEIGPRGPFLLVELYKDAGEYEAALNIVIKLMEQSPKEDIKLINLRGTLLMMLKRFDEARPYLEKAESMAPANMERLSVMADLYLQVNEPDKSSEKFQTLISLRPDQPETKFTAMDALMAHGFAKHAKKLCDATTMPKEIIRHYNNKGVMLTKEGKHDEAIKLYDYALTYFPDYMENYRIMYNIVLAKLHLKEKGYVKECIALLEKCVTMAPDFDKAQKALRTLHDAIKKPKSDDPKGGAAA